MSHRVFKDSQGTEWQAWDILPQLIERRADDRRQVTIAADAVVTERRRAERRVVTGRRPVLSFGLDGGWLCFETQAEKRRLAPIPEDWMRCDDACMERYCRLAKPAPRSSVALDIVKITDRRN
jgi:hypothetical protein